MTTFLLIRHAMCDPVGQAISGRQPGVHLNETGRRQATVLAERLHGIPLTALYSSPLERAMETARPIGLRQNLEVRSAAGFNEIEFGEWTGRSLAELEGLPEWGWFNSYRSGSSIPGGENIPEVLSRVLRELDRLRALHPEPKSKVAVVSHGDVLRSLLAQVLGISLDLIHRVELSPASISILELESYGPRLLLLNSTAEPGEGFSRSK
jgi:probable phosphoglycerate mutase